ncbi:N-acetyl sugar amidotransferase [Candidatus Peregrinibacteria bacterium]|nr:N-acetyl sugar amidotransferase [Candidatus Peregrinibacteria bacterium]
MEKTARGTSEKCHFYDKNEGIPLIICTRCVCDTTIPEIVFDENGVCQFCKMHDLMEKMYPLNEQGEKNREKLIRKIKKNGKNNRYDCVIGTSGGTDSTYMLYLAVKAGLRPLAVHFDNGWNSEIAVRNIQNSTKKLNIDLETVVADWEEFKDLQIAFLKASVSDAEIPTDVAIHAVLHDVAAKENIKYVFFGHSFRNEGIVPVTWTYMEGKYVNSVHEKFGQKKITSFPNITLGSLFYYRVIKGIKCIPFMNYFQYDKLKAKKLLEEELDWRYYGGHHHESLFTKFFQSYYLPKKFNIDKRKLEYAAFIRSGMMTREQALSEMGATEYPYEEDLIEYVLEKLGLSREEFDAIMKNERKSFHDYKTYYPLLKALKLPIYIGFKFGFIPEIIYFKYFK